MFGPAFNRLAEVLRRDPTGLSLRSDATAMAPERLLVFEVRGPVSSFADAIRKIHGLELVDEEELATDEADIVPTAYLMVPDVRALKELESLWHRWRRGELRRGETPWGKVFELLRDLRPWGPADRVRKADADFLRAEIEDRGEDELIRLEIELVFRTSDESARSQERSVNASLRNSGGRLVASSRIPDIAYHALLVDLPVSSVRDLLNGSPLSLSAIDPVMHVRPQSIATGLTIEDSAHSRRTNIAVADSPAILALFDGVPVAAHPLLSSHVRIDDQFNLVPSAPVDQRIHGSAMASLIIHGDLNKAEAPLRRQIHVVPVLGSGDSFPRDRLIVDVIYLAVLAMREGEDPTAPGVLIVNLSLGNARSPFQGQLSAWARLLDRLAYHYGILFIVSAGNHKADFPIADFATRTEFEDSAPRHRAESTLRATANLMADRRLLAPGETVNGVTVGASNDDSVSIANRRTARVNIDPYVPLRFSNPSSALGPGFSRSTKPDFLMPGAKEHLMVVRNHSHIEVRPAQPGRYAGLQVAAPTRADLESPTSYTNGTSAATALASRTAHRIHDALEATYGDVFVDLPHIQRAVILKALLAHPAKWPTEAAAIIKSTIGPADGRQHVRQKDNIRRFLGYGFVDSDEAIACAADRATFWATGLLRQSKVASVLVPIPTVISGKARPHALTATLAWFTPVLPGRRTYRAVRLKILEPRTLDDLKVQPNKDQPDTNQSNRGTLISRTWIGDRAPRVDNDMTIRLDVQREPDQGSPIDEAVPFGLAVTLTMPGVEEIYEQVQARLAVYNRVRLRA